MEVIEIKVLNVARCEILGGAKQPCNMRQGHPLCL